MRVRPSTSSILAALLVVAAGAAEAGTISVGPTRALKTPSQAAAVARDGDIVEIDAGLYARDVAVWTASNLTLRGVGGRAHLRADGANAQGKAIWVITGRNTTVEDIEFSGAAVSSQNGAGIRQEGAGLTVRRCYFHDNENGILAGALSDGDILVEHSEFARNGYGDGYSHNIYIGAQRSFTLRYSYMHHARVGHNVKSRALKNQILYNRIADEGDGTASYSIDLPNGGESYVIGNSIQQGPATSNPGILSYAAEGASNPVQQLYVINNTFVNDRSSGGTFIAASGAPVVRITNNIFVGQGTIASGQQAGNLVSSGDPGFVDRAAYDYRLTASSAAIDRGVAPGTANGVNLMPAWHYVHVAGASPRTVSGSALDAGAFERSAATAPRPPANVRIY